MHGDTSLPNEAKVLADLLLVLLRQLRAGIQSPVVNLPLGQLRVCVVLRGGPMPMSAIGREVGASMSAMTQIADRLERARLVKRVPRGDDRRVRCLQLTERGKRMMQLHHEARVGEMAKVLQTLSPSERQAVTAAMQTLVKAAIATKSENEKSLENCQYLGASVGLL